MGGTEDQQTKTKFILSNYLIEKHNPDYRVI